MFLLIGATTPWVQPQQKAASEAMLNTHISAGDGVCFLPGLLASLSINHKGGCMRQQERTGTGCKSSSLSVSACEQITYSYSKKQQD